MLSFSRFNTNTEVTFEQVNRSKGSHPITHHNGNVTLALAEGVMHDVFVSSIVGGGKLFLIREPGIALANY